MASTNIKGFADRIIFGVKTLLDVFDKVIVFLQEMGNTIIIFVNYLIELLDSGTDSIPLLTEGMDIFKIVIPLIMLVYIGVNIGVTIIN